MYIQQLYTNCLAEAAYYIESDGQVAIIDPLRDTEPYLNLAEKRNAKIHYIFETHFHADFVSGHLDLQRKTGASIIYGPGAKASYPIYEALDEEIFTLGKIKIRVLHTPGHTLESCCYLLLDEDGKEHSVFTGDTLFIGDVGRPDLACSNGTTREDLAGLLYDSIHKKLMNLSDEVIVYPGHGAGSACGKNIGKETVSSIGEQKRNNYALKASGKKEFIEKVTEGLLAPPQYFFTDAKINKSGYRELELVMRENKKALSAKQFAEEIRRGAIVLDTRDAKDFEKSFIPGSVWIGLNGSFAVWSGTVLPSEAKLILVCDIGKEEEVILRLARIGYENIKGYLKGGYSEWLAEDRAYDTIQTVSAEEFYRQSKYPIQILDVRNENEWESGVCAGCIRIPLGALNDQLSLLNRFQPIYIYCAGGYRSMIASSILKKNYFMFVYNVEGGMASIRKTNYALSTVR
jgi:glyoxylase-like metal-dependent hydrolase (beta-lactamase superfamily II)/rhodanese-related sulfurtransferase